MTPFGSRPASSADLQQPNAPIRAELFSIERLEQHAETLAAAQHITPRLTRGRPLVRRLHDNAQVLTETYRTLVGATHANQPITPAAEWLLDNFHVVDEQVRQIKGDLPPGFYAKLPKLADGPLEGFPRVFGIAWAIVAHTDSGFDLERLTRFVAAYQRVQPLSIGELWALAITLRITLVENLRRLAEVIGLRLSSRQLADRLADQILGTDKSDPEPADSTLPKLQKAKWSIAFAVQLALRLRDRDPETTPALRWLNEKLGAEGTSLDEIVHEQVQRQGGANVTVRNVITSMRLVSTINWAEFFESVSPVDAIMRDGSDFGAMDFSTRDLYRGAIETLARGSGLEETDVAARAIAAAKLSAAKGDEGHGSDPGYYLVARGRRAFEKALSCRVRLPTSLLRLNSDLGVTSYVAVIAVVTAILVGLALLAIAHVGAGGWALLGLAIVGVVPASDVAVAFVNRTITQQVGAMRMPGLELRKGVPPECRTIIVVPALLTRPENIEAQIQRLEVHHLSSPGDEFVFALLSDWTDCLTEHAEDDDALLATAVAGIGRLNLRYGPLPDGARFRLLHRPRSWNEGEGKWIGWERKRGKLHELNRLLRGATDTGFLPIEGEAASLPCDLRYVITLDADTRLPIGAARRLVGKIAHPLNRAHFDPATGLVTKGYGILQPRVTPSLPIGSQGSLFERVFSGPNGLDPYALAVSDIYQDLFEQGSYCGKGIYDIDAFAAALNGQVPENTVLSHDLLEGILARCGLVSDIEVVEEFPSRYDVSSARQHRWVRGDWQLLPWIFGVGYKAADGHRKTALPLMGRWKLLDNLRRSLSAPTALLALLVGWFQPPAIAEVWTAFVLLTIVLPPFLPAIAGLIPRRSGFSMHNHVRSLRSDLELGALQCAFLITFLAHQAWLMVDAMLRTLSRLFVHRRHLLEWVSAAQSDDETQFSRRGLIRQFLSSVVFAVALLVALYLRGRISVLIAAPFALLWVLSPFIARWSSLPPPASGHLTIKAADALALRLIARRTWRFFETFVTAEDNMLPPDNFQEDPNPVVAHRTSPTNIGLYLLSVVAARDFGWIGTLDALDRVEATLATVGKMEQFRGHLYNWYDTCDLHPLEPKYISSVDSGNLAGHLLALSNTCAEIVAGPVISASWRTGLEDTLALVREASGRPAAGVQSGGVADTGLHTALDAFSRLLQQAATSPADISRRLADLAMKAAKLTELAAACSRKSGEAVDGETAGWIASLRACIASHQRDLQALAPWAALPPSPTEMKDGCATAPATLPTLVGAPALCATQTQRLLACAQHEGAPCQAALNTALQQSSLAAIALKRRLEAVADATRAMFHAMEFGFLFDEDRQLLSIGYRMEDGTLDANVYDLLASEARLASFIGIAKGDLPAKHWFRLGRTMTPIDGGSGLISWSGSMFEYLMPSLVMRAPAGSLLEETNRLIVWRQARYGDKLGVPWGMSESEYDVRDIEQTYQYSSFGVPDLGYKRGLGDSIVIAPYATGLAAMVDPGAATRNYARLAGLGARGAYGWYEALDFTRSRLPDGTRFALVGAYMAHHQAMALVGIANALHNGRMRHRFHAEPIVQAAELLLQERMPREVAMARPRPEQAAASKASTHAPETQKRYGSAHSHVPRTQILSNGRYSIMLTGAGSGYSRWGDIAVTRWREDVTCDSWGAYVFLRDVRNGETWSAGYQPSLVEPEGYEVTFAEDRAEICRRDATLSTVLDVMVSPEDDAEVRRVSITNHGLRTREIELTSYAELALARQADDVAHPAFAKLFVQTEFVPSLGAILATRRQRSSADPLVWAAHLAVVEGETSGEVQFETDRARFMGRGRTLRSSAMMADGWPLSNSSGAVLDPVFSLRRRVRVPRGGTARIAFWTVVAASREQVLALADKHHDPMAFDRAAAMAWTQAQTQLRHLAITSDEAHLFQRLANCVLYADPALRPPTETLASGLRAMSTLWEHGLSGDLPILLVRIAEDGDMDLVRQLLRAHEYWRLKSLAVDLVILNERAASYVQDLQAGLEALVRMNPATPRAPSEAAAGTVVVLRADLLSASYVDLLNAAARGVLHGGRGSLTDQLNRTRNLAPALATPVRPAPAPSTPEAPIARPHVEFFNGLGGFTDDGREYLTVLEGDAHTPAPWINIVANPAFGFQVSTEGGGFTWSQNSQQNQLTPWSNDPVGDAPGEAIYVCDEETGDIWTPTALPIRETASAYVVRHGQGYSRFEHAAHGISLELLQYVPVDDPIKISRLKITNLGDRERRLSIAAYVEWVLGANRTATATYVVTEIDPQTGAMFARNPWSDPFGARVAFADLNGRQSAWTGDRTEFLGRNGGLDWPLGLAAGTALSNRTGAGLDPCGALQTQVKLGPSASTEVVFFLGQAATGVEAQALVESYRKADLDAVLAEVTRQWDQTLGAVQVKTPDRAMDILLNRWLPYQTLACRVWARTGFYQASGAYGFRDQLQDVMALCVLRPEIAREHLLRAAARQFPEGDVQHWWLPNSGSGIRTRVSDDRGWLAYVVAHYVEVTGDAAVLDEPVAFLEGPTIKEGARDAFFQPTVSLQTASLFDHCALALDKSLAVGAHGLPLMGAGDWNDGMDQVGEGGRGESVWLGWFLYSTLHAFAKLADRRDGGAQHASDWRAQAAALQASLERDGWDGDWYRRAYFDDGTPLGSASSTECRIDSIAQSWAVISGAADPVRAKRAMAAVDKYLIRPDEKLSLLFTPPFDHPTHDPGYIKGYPPGVRENGGQYTHGAVWAALAAAMQGDGDKAGELLSMLNPIRHADSPTGVHRYKVEPYVACADVYSEPPHVGRGGWTWYTGSAGWLYRVALERLLGFRVQGATLVLDPCIPHTWPGFQISFRHRSTPYEIKVENPNGVCRGVLTLTLDGEPIAIGEGMAAIPLVDDGAPHTVRVGLG